MLNGGTVLGLIFGARPEGGRGDKSADQMIGNGGIEHGLDGIELAGDLALAGTGDDEPERLAIGGEMNLNVIQC